MECVWLVIGAFTASVTYLFVRWLKKWYHPGAGRGKRYHKKF